MDHGFDLHMLSTDYADYADFFAAVELADAVEWLRIRMALWPGSTPEDEATYQQLLAPAKRLRLSPEDMLEQLLLGGLALPLDDAHDPDLGAEANLSDSTAALAAVDRTTRFCSP